MRLFWNLLRGAATFSIHRGCRRVHRDKDFAGRHDPLVVGTEKDRQECRPRCE